MRYLLLAVVAIIAATIAHASPISKVGSAKVTKGQTSVEFRSGKLLDNDTASSDQRWQFATLLDYGITDWYALRITVSQDNRQGDNLEHDVLDITQRLQFFNVAEHGFDGGIRLTYGHKDGDKRPSKAGLRLMAVVPVNRWEIRHNSIIEHDIGPEANDGVGYEARFEATYPVHPKHRVGFDLFSDFGNLRELSGYDDQSHEFGPVALGKLPLGVNYEAGYRAGLSRGAVDHTFRFFLGKKF